MAQLTNSLVNGYLRVTGTTFSDVAASIVNNPTVDELNSIYNSLKTTPVVNKTIMAGLVSPIVPAPTWLMLKLNAFRDSSNLLYFDGWYGTYHLEATYDSALGAWSNTTTEFLTTSGASNIYLRQDTASSTYLTQASASSTYETLLTGSRGVQKSLSASDGSWPGTVSSTGSDSGKILGFNCTEATKVHSTQGLGIAFSGIYGGGLTYNSSYILGSVSNPAFSSISDKGYDSSLYYFNGCSKAAIVAKSAATCTGSAASAGYSGSLTVTRKTGSSENVNSLVSSNRVLVAEFGTDVQNSPASGSWTHVISTQGDDTGYATQIGVGMTADGMWYRRKITSGWQGWHKVMNTDAANKDSGALSNLMNPLDEGTSDFSDGTELISSIAENTGFSTSGHVYQPYRRKASSMRNYIAGYGTGIYGTNFANFSTTGMSYGDFYNSGTPIYGWKIGTSTNSASSGWSNSNFVALAVIEDWASTDSMDCGVNTFVGIVHIFSRMNSATVSASNWVRGARLHGITPQKTTNSSGNMGWAIFMKANASTYTATWYIGRCTASNNMNGAIRYSKISLIPLFENTWERKMERMSSTMVFDGQYDLDRGTKFTPQMWYDDYGGRGNDNTPVYISDNRMFEPCNNVYAAKIKDASSGNYLSVSTGTLGADANTLYIL